ncbi:MAG: DUF4038 domain-containing protein [Bacteroidetes bacterium]|nr:DUF4038 domain-containing protein [Fibrella sp.]
MHSFLWILMILCTRYQPETAVNANGSMTVRTDSLPSTTPRRANWVALNDTARSELRQQALFGGGQQQERSRAVRMWGLSVENVNTEGVRLRTDTTYARLEVSPAQLQLPANWETYRELTLTLHNTSAHPLTVSSQLVGSRSVLLRTDTLLADQTKRILIDLRDLPITAGIAPNPYAPGFLRWVLTGVTSHQQLHIRKLTLHPMRATDSRAVVDRFGQRIRGNWPGKITSVSDLHRAAQAEEAELKAQPGSAQSPDAPGTFRATGFFRVEQDTAQRWWFITPDGRRFWSFGVTGVRTNGGRAGVTPYASRGYLFEKLPEQPQAYEPQGVRFYTANALQKWGSREKWRAVALWRLQSWGMNTLGNWSDTDVLAASSLPYTRTFSTNPWPDLMVGQTNVSDVFHPDWAARVDTLLRQASQHQRETLLLGYFIDNEQTWEAPYLLTHARPDSPIRRVWLRLLQQEFGNIEALNRALQTRFADWPMAANLKPADLPGTAPLATAFAALEIEFAQTYFRTVAGTLKKYDPNHLYLGCRFTKRIKPKGIVETAGRYCDVLTVNVYDRIPNADNMRKWHAYSGRPILIGEHHLSLSSERTLPPTYGASPPAVRETYFEEYVAGWAAMPFAVGSHWYQFADQELTGRSTDGENQPIGLVDITDQPHAELVRASRRIGRQPYRWHGMAQPAGVQGGTLARAALPSGPSQLRVSANGRGLVQKNGTPFFWLGDTAWNLFSKLNPSEADRYLTDRAAKHFTVIQAHLLPWTLATPGVNGHTAFRDGDFDQPDAAYWQSVDTIISLAAQRNLYLALLPTWCRTYTEMARDSSNRQNVVLTDSAKAYRYGYFLGRRYQQHTNLIWVLGGDQRPARHAVYRQLAKGLTDAGAGGDPAQILLTYHPPGGTNRPPATSSGEFYHAEPWLDMNMIQSGHALGNTSYERISDDVARKPAKPTLDAEPCYEAHPVKHQYKNGLFGAWDVRRRAYWSVLAGACGFTYGGNGIWQMDKPGQIEQASHFKDYWYDALNYEGAGQMQHLRHLAEAYHWPTWISDTTLVDGSIGRVDDRIQSIRTAGADCFLHYITNGRLLTLRPLPAGQWFYHWFDPRTGKPGPVQPVRSARFTPPSTGSGSDWVLIVTKDRRVPELKTE